MNKAAAAKIEKEVGENASQLAPVVEKPKNEAEEKAAVAAAAAAMKGAKAAKRQAAEAAALQRDQKKAS